MAKARVSTNPMYTGGAGGYSFYVRGGEQVVRQRRNNSNYGETASRSEAQMLRRVRWANLVNMYKACKFWMPKAFETKSKGQTDYNLFMSMNINEARVALTKDMAQNGCAVNAGQYVSRGSIAPIALYEYDTGVGAELEIAMTITPGASTTVGQFAADIIANNPVFQENDNIAVVMFINTQDGRNYPYLQSVYSEITLKTSDTRLLQSVTMMNRISKSNGGRLKFAVGASQSHESGVAFIHTRRVGGELQVSTQRVFQTGENINGEYDSDLWVQECVDSYGLDEIVPLDPGAGGVTPSWYLYLKRTMSGEGTTGVESSAFRLPVGHYRGAVSPNVWEVPEGVPDANNVFTLVSSPLEDFSSSVQFITTWSAEQMNEEGALLPYEFDVSNGGLYYKFILRANETQTVDAFIYRNA